MDHFDHNEDQKNTNTANGYMKLAGVDDNEYDALADLFLGDSELAPKQDTQIQEPKPNESRPSDRIAPSHATKSAPDRLTPNQPVEVRAMDLLDDVQLRIDQAVNEAAKEVSSTNTPVMRQANAPALNIEAILLGHLPVRASLWVRQYACSTARREGQVVALIRAASGSTSIDLISPSQPIETIEFTDLHEALIQVNQLADRVILRVDETTEPELLDRDEINEITILTGADEAAIVASYRLIKTLTNAWESDEPTAIPHLRLAVMGATGQQIDDARSKLARAVDAFLDRPIEIIDAAGRIDATGTTNIFRDTKTHQPICILDELINIESPVPVKTEFAPRAQESLILPTPKPEIQSNQIESKPITRKPAANTWLASLIPDLSLLESRCPFALDVELCVDQQGQLHIITGDDFKGPMTRLETVRAWVRDHLPLILRAEPKLAMPTSSDRSSDIGMHLITSDPQLLRGLIDSPVHVYALATATIADESVNIATPVN